jgi:hypothetical protein
MENLISDNSFEVYHNSEGSKILAMDRTLMEYPSEKSSFDVFMGFTDENKDGKDDKTGKTKKQLDEEEAKKKKQLDEEEAKKKEREEKFKEYASIGKDAIQTGQAVYGAVKSFQPKSKQDLKSVCGRKPLRKKNRPPYDKCVANYMASLNTGGDTGGGDTGGQKSGEIEDEKPPKSNTTKYIIAGVIVLGLIGGFIYLKKTGKI